MTTGVASAVLSLSVGVRLFGVAVPSHWRAALSVVAVDDCLAVALARLEHC